MLLNQWDATAHGAVKNFRFYHVEVEEIAQQTRKNSKLKSVERNVNKAIRFRMKLKKWKSHSTRKPAKDTPYEYFREYEIKSVKV